MPVRKILAIIFIVGGILVLAYGGFSYAEEQHDLGIGSLELQVTEKEHVAIPQWIGIAGIAIGAGMLLIPGGKS